jgi:hypothetical protein
MSRNVDWKSYVNAQGDFELPNYLYRTFMELMKQALDMGTLLSEDQAKLRAYKEQIKKHFKTCWFNTAQALEFFDMVIPCTCRPTDYCEICGGSRYVLNHAVSPDKLREVAVFYGAEATSELADKLHQGLLQALRDLGEDVDEMSSLQ